MSRRRALLLFALLSLLCVGCDQATKLAAQEAFERPLVIGSGLVIFDVVHNPGAFLSLGSTLPDAVRAALFLVLAPLAMLVVLGSLLRTRGVRLRAILAAALVAGGGLGNWVDRALRGEVVDFVSVGAFGLRTGIFNAADVFIVTGALLLIAFEWRGDPEPAETTATPSAGQDVAGSARDTASR
jgi:signal peptidase II